MQRGKQPSRSLTKDREFRPNISRMSLTASTALTKLGRENGVVLAWGFQLRGGVSKLTKASSRSEAKTATEQPSELLCHSVEIPPPANHREISSEEGLGDSNRGCGDLWAYLGVLPVQGGRICRLPHSTRQSCTRSGPRHVFHIYIRYGRGRSRPRQVSRRAYRTGC